MISGWRYKNGTSTTRSPKPGPRPTRVPTANAATSTRSGGSHAPRRIACLRAPTSGTAPCFRSSGTTWFVPTTSWSAPPAGDDSRCRVTSRWYSWRTAMFQPPSIRRRQLRQPLGFSAASGRISHAPRGSEVSSGFRLRGNDEWRASPPRSPRGLGGVKLPIASRRLLDSGLTSADSASRSSNANPAHGTGSPMRMRTTPP